MCTDAQVDMNNNHSPEDLQATIEQVTNDAMPILMQAGAMAVVGLKLFQDMGVSKAIAAHHYLFFAELQEAGFTADQALQIVASSASAPTTTG